MHHSKLLLQPSACHLLFAGFQQPFNLTVMLSEQIQH
jgi:hypothetical protein